MEIAPEGDAAAGAHDQPLLGRWVGPPAGRIDLERHERLALGGVTQVGDGEVVLAPGVEYHCRRVFLQVADPLSILLCPACRRSFRLVQGGDGTGLAACACGENPFVEGVFVAHDGGPTARAGVARRAGPGPQALHARLRAAVRAGDGQAARHLLLGSYARRVRLMERLGVRLTFRRFLRRGMLARLIGTGGLYGVVEKLPPQSFTERVLMSAQFSLYMRHRFCAPSFLSAIPLLGLVRGARGLVLDAPCGMGHLAYTLTKLVPPSRLVCMDLLPAHAFSARRFFAPGALAAIAHDMNEPLPLVGGAFSAIFCSDAFHYVTNKAQLAREFMRLLGDDGVLAILHLHNRLQHNPAAGDPLSPAEYARLFEGFAVRLYPERHLVDAYLADSPLDLGAECSEGELNEASALALVAAKSPAAFRVVPSVREQLLAAAHTPRLNELYRRRRRGGQIILQRRLPRTLVAEYPRLVDALPERAVVPAGGVRRDGGWLRFTDERRLLRQHVLLDLPVDY